MPRLVINSIQELKIFQTKIKVLQRAIPSLQKQSMDKMANGFVLDKIKSKMRLNDFSEKIIDATFVGNTELAGNVSRTHFISNYVADNGFDVSNAREEETASGIERRPKKPGGSLRWIGPGNKPIFRKFSRPSGIERLLIIEKTIKEVENQSVTIFKNNLSNLVSKFLGV